MANHVGNTRGLARWLWHWLRRSRAQWEEWEMRQPVLYSSQSSDWCTPPDIITRVLKVLGHIDLDPCADINKTVPALHHYTEEDNGLRFGWFGKVYMNPPYGKVIGSWVDKLVTEYQVQRINQAIVLVPGRIDTRWFHKLMDCEDSVMCFLRGRLKFSGQQNFAPFPSAAVYLGQRSNYFASAFGDIGKVIWNH